MREQELYRRLRRRAALAELLARRKEQELARIRAAREEARATAAHIAGLMPAPTVAQGIAQLAAGASLRALLEPARQAALGKSERLDEQAGATGREATRARTKANRVAEKRDDAKRQAASKAELRIIDDRPPQTTERPL